MSGGGGQVMRSISWLAFEKRMRKKKESEGRSMTINRSVGQ